jgi:gliding motility-associated-like protein
VPKNNGDTIVPVGIKYRWWYIDNGDIDGEVNETIGKDTIAGTLTNNTNVLREVRYRVVGESGQLGHCVSDTFDVRIAVSPTPEILDTVTTICSNSSFKIKPENLFRGDIVPVGTTYTWNVIQNIKISGYEQVTALRDSISDTLRNKTNQQDTLYYRVEPSVGGKCKGDSFTVKVAINPTPEIGLHADTICNNGTFAVIPINDQPTTIVPNATTYTWSFTDNTNVNGEQNQTTGVGNITGTLQNITQVSQLVQYTVTPKSGDVGNCVGNSFNVNVVVRPDAKSEFTSDTTIACAPFILKNHLNVIRYTEANDETQYKWFADGMLIGTGLAVPNYAIINPADTVVITLIAKSAYGCKDDTSSITLYTVQKPIPGFTKSTDSVCGPYKIYFKNTTTPVNVINGSKYEWDFGNGLPISTLVQPDSILFNPDNINYKDTTYYISLKVMTVCDTLIVKDSVLIKSLPKALFQPDTTVTCSSIPLGFRNISKGSEPIYFIWDWDDGKRDTVLVSDPNKFKRIYHKYITEVTDTFNVKIYAFNECGVDSFAVPILVYSNTVYPKIIVDGPGTYGCTPQEVIMRNTSSGGTKYVVDFGDGTPSYTTTKSIDTIKHWYTTSGTFTIKLRGTNDGCADTTSFASVTIYPTPVASFKTDSTAYCQKDSVRITNLSTYDSDIQYTWNFGDGSPEVINILHPTHKYLFPGTYTIKLTVDKINPGSTCQKDTSLVVTINPSPVADFTTNSGTYNCAPFTFVGTTNSPDYANVNWFFLNDAGVEIPDGKRSGLNINYTISQPGLYKVKMVAFNSFGCTDTIIKSLKVEETPKPRFTVPDTVYCGLSANATFTNTSIYGGTDVVAYEWLVDGVTKSATSTQFNYTFASPPNTIDPVYFKVRLIAKASMSGCNDYFEKTITLLPLPQPKLTAYPDSGCSPLTVNLTNNAKYADAYQWKLNGVIFSTDANPAPVVLPASGTTYIFELVADNTKGGCGPVSAFDTVRTLPTPTALFKLNNSIDDTIKYCNSQTIRVNDNSYINAIGNKVGLVYQWYINDILQGTTFANPVFQLTNNSYTNDELFEIKLIVASASGCKDTLSKYVLLYPKPKANVLLNGGNSDCAMPLYRLVKTVDNLSQVKTPETYSWSVYNRTSASPMDGVLISDNIAASPMFSFPDNHTASDTTYDIRLIVTSVNGCADTTTNTQIVYARPMVNYRVTDTVSCKGNLRVTFFDISVSPTSTITDRLWNFDDGIEGKTPSITHDYNVHGLYYPSLFVKNANGCFSDTLRKRIKIFGAPQAAFLTPASVCMGTDLNPINNSTLGWGSIAFNNILWDFGDGKTSNVLSPIHQYTAPGNYTITLSINSDSSCVSASKTATIAVIGKPTADFSYSSLCAGKPIIFINNSTKGYGDKGFNLVKWEFGDATSSLLFNAQHTFNSPNNYEVQMIVEGSNCPQLKDTMLKRMDIKLVSRPDSIYPVIYATKGEELTLMAANDGINYLWSPSTGLSNPSQQVTNALYLSAIPNKINYNILISDSSGCEINDQQEVWVFEKPEVYAPTAFSPNGDGANDVFIPFYVNIKSLQSFRIFNRWGEKIFDTNNLTKGWDGVLANGIKAPLESYSWVVECYDVNGIKLIRKGMVTLIRN